MVFCPSGLDWKEREFLSSFLKPSDGKLGSQLFVPDSFIESQRKLKKSAEIYKNIFRLKSNTRTYKPSKKK